MHRRTLLAGTAAALAAPSIVRAQGGQGSDWPKGPIAYRRALPARRHDRSGGAHPRRQGERQHRLVDR